MSNNEFYNLTNDYLFKKIFSDKENMKILLKDFFDIEAKEIIYKNTELLKSHKNMRYGIVDMLIKVDKTLCILELQNLNRYNFKERIIYYVSAITHNYGLNKNEDYKNLRCVKALAIINYNDDINDLEDFVKVTLQTNKRIFSNRIEYNIVNLKKKDNNGLYKFFKCKSLDELKEYKNDTRYKNIYEKIKYYNLNKKGREKMDDIAKMLMEEKENYNGALEYGFIQGEKKGQKNGIIIGEKKKNLEIAKTMLNEEFDISIISKITKLPENELKQLQNHYK